MTNLNQQAHAYRRKSLDQIANHFKFPFLGVVVLIVAVVSLSLSQASRASSSSNKQDAWAQAAACGASSDLVEKIRHAQRSDAAKMRPALSQAPELSCSQLLIQAGGLLVRPETSVSSKVLDNDGRLLVAQQYGAVVYGALKQCYLHGDRDAVKESFRHDQLVYVYADRPSLIEIGLKNSIHAGQYTGYAQASKITPADCSDALIVAGKNIKAMAYLAKERADKHAVKEGELIAVQK